MTHHEESHGSDGQTVNPIQVQKFLGGVDYPVDKQQVLKHAKQHGADERTMETLQRLPDRKFDGPNAISQEIGKQQ